MSDATVEKFEHAGCTIEIVYDDDPPNPREDCNLGTMVHWHRRSEIGDENIRHLADDVALEDLPDYFRRERGATVVLPVYLYDHSGMTVNTTGFSCPWDSGQVGFVFDTPEGRENCGTPPELIEQCLRDEVATYDDWLTGQAYGFVVERDGDEIESCFGFLGDWGLEEAKREAKAAAESEQRAHDLLGTYEAAH